jgi:hypothetical protein
VDARDKPGHDDLCDCAQASSSTVCDAQAFAAHGGTENLIATMTGTLMALPRRG